jgi:hypothetical protein
MSKKSLSMAAMLLAASTITTRPARAQFDFLGAVRDAVQSIGEGAKHVINEADKIATQVRPIDIDFNNGGVVRFNWGGIAETRYDPRDGVWRPFDKGIVLRAPEDVSAGATGAAIRYSRDRARSGSRPLPHWVRSVLAPFFSADILANAQYSYDWGAAQNFTVQQPTLASGNYNAISLIDTIVFRGQTLQSRNGDFDLEQPGWQSIYLWAHEITHLEQYKRLGVEEFARWMIRDYTGLLENPAQINGERVANVIDQAANRLSGEDVQTSGKCRRGSGAIFSIRYTSGVFYLFGDCNMDAYRYFPEYDRREETPSGRIVPAGRGFAAIDGRGNMYFARLERYR